MEWEDLARKQKGKKSKSYCVSNSTLKSVAEYCSEKKKKMSHWDGQTGVSPARHIK